jgi:methyl-accepting chemotaxis protein
MLLPFRSKKSAPVELIEPESTPAILADTASQELARQLQSDTSGLGLEAAQLRGTLEDTLAVADRQSIALQGLLEQLQQIGTSQQAIHHHTRDSLGAVSHAREAVQNVGQEVSALMSALHAVADAAQQITRIALQTRLVAFNASVEAKRAGEAGRGFSVVADAVKSLSTEVETSSKTITATVAQLDARIQSLAHDISRTPEQGHHTGFQAALRQVEDGVARINQSAEHSITLSTGLRDQAGGMARDVHDTQGVLKQAMGRSEAVLGVSEKLMDVIASCGVKTFDTPYIELAQSVAGLLANAMEKALQTRRVTIHELFDEDYKAIPGSEPVQYLTRFNEVTDACFPAIQEAALEALPGIVFCIGVDRQGYIPTHNRKYCNPQRAGDVTWNTANSRWRRIFNDRTGLASARNERAFLIQTYRRDMGGGQFVMLKEVSAPITVQGRHWGGVRLAYKF